MSTKTATYYNFSKGGVPIRNTADYSPFGVQLDGRTVQGDFYRRGFNGMEKDDEVKGGGNHISWGDYGMDVRIGRRFNIDPEWQRIVSQSVYCVNNNNPIFLHDPDGRFAVPPALVAGALGAVSEVISQLSLNYFDKGFDIQKSFSKLDYSDIAIAAGSAAFWGFFDGGISTFTSFISKSSNRRILKIAAEFIIESSISAVENIAKDYFNNETIDIGAAIAGALVEVGLGEFLPKPKHYERKANNAKHSMKRAEDKMNRKNFNQLSEKKQNKIKNKFDNASYNYKKNNIMRRTIESIEDGTAKALGNKAQEFIKNKNKGITLEHTIKTNENKVY